MRSLPPSTTRAETLTVSPEARSGRSVRIWSATISSRTFTVVFPAEAARDGARVVELGLGWAAEGGEAYHPRPLPPAGRAVSPRAAGGLAGAPSSAPWRHRGASGGPLR